MGLGIAIGGSIAALTVFVIILTYPMVSEKLVEESNARSEIFDITDTIRKTNFAITNLYASSGSEFVNFTLTNTGSEKLWNFEDFHLIVNYDADVGGVSTPTVEEIAFVSSSSFIGSGTETTTVGSSNIGFDDVTSFAGNCSTCSFSHTVTTSGDDRIIIVGTAVAGGKTVDTVTYAGQTLTNVRHDGNAGVTNSTLWYMVNPTTGANNVEVTLSSSDDVVIGVISLIGVDQTSPVDAHNGATGTSDIPSVSIVTSVNEAWIIDVVDTLDGPMTVGASQVEQYDTNQGSMVGAGSTEETTTSGAHTMSWSNSAGSKEWSISAVSLTPSSSNGVQVARPDSDISTGSWVDNIGGDNDSIMFDEIDEASRDDSDYVSSSLITPIGSTDTLEVGLSDVDDPQTSENHIVRYVYRKDASGGSEIELTVRLLQGTTTIGTSTHSNISDTFTFGSFLLSGAEANSISNYDDLRLEFTGERTGGILPLRRAEIAWAELQVPGSQSITELNCNTTAEFNTKNWVIGNVTNDYLDPRILNSEEVAHICIQLENPIFTGGDISINIATDMGKVTTQSTTTS